jgi:hypothetical protein
MRPVKIISIAFDLPTARVRRWVPPAPGGVRSKNEIAHHRDLASPAEREAGDCGDDRLARLRNILPARDEVADESFGECLVLHLLDVGAGGERLLGSGQHDRADSGVGLKDLERCVEVLHQGRRQRIQGLGSVEPDEADRPMGFDKDIGVGHGGPFGCPDSTGSAALSQDWRGPE